MRWSRRRRERPAANLPSTRTAAETAVWQGTAVTDAQQESANLGTRATERRLLPTSTGLGRGLDPEMRPQPLRSLHLNLMRHSAEEPVTALPTHANWGSKRG